MVIRTALYSENTTLQLLLSSALGDEFELAQAPSWEELKSIQTEQNCDITVVELDSAVADLEEKIGQSKQLIAAGAIVVLLADDNLRQQSEDLVRAGAYRWCRKPPSIRDLRTVLRNAHENILIKRKLQQAEQRLATPGGFSGMVGASCAMRQVYDLVRRVADISASVLITGESGSGKELVATAIHKSGARASRPFVAVSCGAIPETLIEAELFGHEKGAYTGTTGAREGYFEQAADGTLFLDEIGELSLSTQVKLLRVLQQREFSRLGSTRLIPLRSRLIFATNSDLADKVEQGTFRRDLYYRIDVMKIALPPLRERAEDIAALANHFLQQYCETYGKRIDHVEPGAMAAIEAYAWPGNIRELENVIQRAIIVSSGNSIRMENLPADLQEESLIDIDELHPAVNSFERQLRDYKIRIAAAAVRENNGNKTLAARKLQISRAYLHRLIRLAEKIPVAAELEPAGEPARRFGPA